eukprot:gene623-112_t
MAEKYKLEQKYPEHVTGPVLLMVLDGFGINMSDDMEKHNTVYLANKQTDNVYFNWEAEAKKHNLFCELAAHGTAVGLPDDTDMGNSEVGHNALGSGQIVDQGAKLVNSMLCGDNPKLFTSENFASVKKAAEGHTVHLLPIRYMWEVHLLGWLSDGGIHSNINQLEIILKNCLKDGIKKIRLHVLTDGRDVSPDSHPQFVKQLEDCLAECNKQGCDYKIASGGGRMYCIMDRYEADWDIVKRGWDAMVHGTIDKSITPEISDKYSGRFKSMDDWSKCVVPTFPDKQDQFYPPFVIVDDNDKPIGAVEDGDVVICFNYRGDRAIEISRAFTETEEQFREGADSAFDRGKVPKVDYYGMLIYDSDKMIPSKSLAPTPDIKDVLSEYLLANGIKSFAVAETHKYGHMTYFWNGNRSGYVNAPYQYFNQQNSMWLRKHKECESCSAQAKKSLEYARRHFAGKREKNEVPSPIPRYPQQGSPCQLEKYCEVASKPATPEQLELRPGMEAEGIADDIIKALNSGEGFKFLRLNFANGDMCGHTGLIPATTTLIDAITEQNGAVIVTADHGNCEEMLDKKGKPMTSHTKKPVPFWIHDKNAKYVIDTTGIERPGLANVAATVCNMFGFQAPTQYHKSLIKYTDASNGNGDTTAEGYKREDSRYKPY